MSQRCIIHSFINLTKQEPILINSFLVPSRPQEACALLSNWRLPTVFGSEGFKIRGDRTEGWGGVGGTGYGGVVKSGFCVFYTFLFNIDYYCYYSLYKICFYLHDFTLYYFRFRFFHKVLWPLHLEDKPHPFHITLHWVTCIKQSDMERNINS